MDCASDAMPGTIEANQTDAADQESSETLDDGSSFLSCGDTLQENVTVLIEGDSILAIGPSAIVRAPKGFVEIRGSGKYLMPGLAEMHGHVPDVRGDPEAVEETLFLYAANGITTVRGMLGWPGQLELRDRALRGDIVSPTLYLAGPSFSGGSVSSPEQAAERVRAQKEEGWDLLKIHPGLTRDEYDAVALTAHELGIRFGGHVPADVGILRAIEAGQETFDHLDGLVEGLNGMEQPVSQRKVVELVERVRRSGAWVVPTMVLWETLYGVNDLDELSSFPELKYVSEATRTSWRNNVAVRVNSPDFDRDAAQLVIDNRMRVLGELNKGGARILMGTDAPQLFSVPGFSLHREVQRMVDAGMTPIDVLRSGTVAVGAYFANADTFGKVKPGHRADLVLLGENPLENIDNLSSREGVMLRGRWLSRSEIDSRLAEIAAKYAGDL